MKLSELKKNKLQRLTLKDLEMADSIQEMFIIKTKIKKVNQEDVLILSMFEREKIGRWEVNEPLITTYFSKNTFHRRIRSDKWSEATINNYLNQYYEKYVWYWPEKSTFLSREDEERFDDFIEDIDFYDWANEIHNRYRTNRYWNLEYEENTLVKVYWLQEWMKNMRLKRKHKKITDRIDKEMEQIKDLPKDWRRFLHNHVMPVYIFYKRDKKTIEGYCSGCGKEVSLKYAKHNEPGTCQSCRRKVIYKAEGKAKKLRDKKQAAYMQKTKEGFVIRYFTVFKDYFGEAGHFNHRNPRLYMFEEVRQFYSNNHRSSRYEWGNFKQTNNYRWCDDTGQYYYLDTYLYPRNIKHIIKDTKWKYSALYELAKHRKPFNLENYLEEYLKYPTLEYFVKLKLYNIVIDMPYNRYYYWNEFREDLIDFKGKNLKEVLKIDKHYIPRLQRLNPTMREFKIFKDMIQRGKSITDEQVKILAKLPTQQNQILEHTTIHKMIKYIKSQQRKDYSLTSICIDWCDYLVECKELKYNLKDDFILFPRDLRARHEETSKLIQDKKDRKMSNKIMAIYNQKNKDLEFSSKGYLIRLAKNSEEISNESKDLKHCVGSYIERVAEERSLILFIRKAENPGQSFYTLELNPRTGKINQCRGYKNADITKEVKRFIEKWKIKRLQSNQEIRGIAL